MLTIAVICLACVALCFCNTSVELGSVYTLAKADDYTKQSASAQREINITVCGKPINQRIVIPTHILLVAEKKGGFYELTNSLLQMGVSPENALNYLCDGFGDAFFKTLSAYETKPVDAKAAVIGKPPYFTYTAGKKGKLFDKTQAAKTISACLDGKNGELILAEAMPTTNIAELKNKTALRSAFSTSIYTSTSNRKHNIAQAMKKINGLYLLPNEEFSFNACVGPRTAENGYKTAKIISDGEYTDGLGGGVCQAASTLYNAALKAGLHVTSASRHTFCPTYVAPSLDAMVSSLSDLRFVNNTSNPIYIFAGIKDNTAFVRIYGTKASSPTVVSEIIAEKPYFNVDEKGRILQSVDGYTLVSNGHNGIQSRAVITTDKNRRVIRKDEYKRKDAIWRKNVANQ